MNTLHCAGCILTNSLSKSGSTGNILKWKHFVNKKLAQFVNFYDKKYNMGKDKKKEAELQRCLRLKRKSELSKYKAFYAYAQIKKPG